jgi:hypothetical protein
MNPGITFIDNTDSVDKNRMSFLFLEEIGEYHCLCTTVLEFSVRLER